MSSASLDSTTAPPGKPNLSVQFSSVTQSCPTLCNPMDCSMPGFPVPELAQTHVHQVGDAIQPSHPLLSPSPPAFYIYINIYKMKVTQSCQTLWSRGLYSPWNSRGQNTGVCSLSLLQGVFPTQGLNPGLMHCRQILYQLSNQGNQWIPEWVAYPFCCGSSQPRNAPGSPALHVDSLPSELSIYLSMGFPHSSVG